MCVEMELPRYQCHKIVHALKIKAVFEPARHVNEESDGSMMIQPEDARYANFRVDHQYVRKHNPQAGGYYVVYDDGYKSFSPAKAFEDGYTLIQ